MSTAAPSKEFKVTYSAVNADMTQFHKLFDEGLAWAHENAGKKHALVIDGKKVESKLKRLTVKSPIDGALLGEFSVAGPKELDAAVTAARKAQKAWARMPWQDRLGIMRRASAEIRRRKWQFGAVMSLEVGKNRMEAMGDAEESADLIDYYAQTMEESDGFSRPLGKLSPNERTRDVLRPYGVFLCIAPFNFPLALSTGMSAAALMAGNAVVYKPSPFTPWTGALLAEVYEAAGLPAGVFNYVPARLEDVGQDFWNRDDVDGIVFTGSRDVGLRFVKEFPKRYPKPVLMEGGGKNAAIVCESADLDMAAEGVMKSAFGMSGQKCSACSRVYVDKRVAKAFVAKLVEKTKAIKIGDPTVKDVYLGPVISEASVKRYEKATAEAGKRGELLLGGERLKDGAYGKGWYVSPAIAQLDLDDELYRRELFVPFVAVGVVDGLEQAIAEANKAEYGLTAGIFSSKKEELERFFDEIEAGVCYANRRTGATTGAWPGVQSFCGWKGSGATGKGGCGPYYVQQFMREQSRTVME